MSLYALHSFGARWPEAMLAGEVLDPGNGKTIEVSTPLAYCNLRISGANETRRVARPPCLGALLLLGTDAPEGKNATVSWEGGGVIIFGGGAYFKLLIAIPKERENDLVWGVFTIA